MVERFLCRVAGVLGTDPCDLQEVRLLSRVIGWGPDCIRYEADPRHADCFYQGASLGEADNCVHPRDQEET